jgi:hypothetical protein
MNISILEGKIHCWDPDPHVFGPPGSGSIIQSHGSGSFPFFELPEIMLAKNFEHKIFANKLNF